MLSLQVVFALVAIVIRVTDAAKKVLLRREPNVLAPAKVVCAFTVDEKVMSVYYNGVDITSTVVGNLTSASSEKNVSLYPVEGAYLVISGRKTGTSSCTSGGFSIQCNWNSERTPADFFSCNARPRNPTDIAYNDCQMSSNCSVDIRKGLGSNWSSTYCYTNSSYNLDGRTNFFKVWASSGAPNAAFRIRFDSVNQVSSDTCDCTCYGPSMRSNLSSCLCQADNWLSCRNGFGNQPLAMGPAIFEEAAVCCPYHWKFFQDKQLTRLLTYPANTTQNKLVARIDMSNAFVLRFTVTLLAAPTVMSNILHITNGSSQVSDPAFHVFPNRTLRLTFGDDLNPNRSAISTLTLTLNKLYNFELIAQDCPVPTCVSLTDSNGQVWLSLQSPVQYQAAVRNASVFVSSPFTSPANARVQNVDYSALPLNVNVLSGYPVNLETACGGQLASLNGALNFRLSFDITRISNGSGAIFSIKTAKNAPMGTVFLNLNSNSSLTVIVPTSDGKSDRNTSALLLENQLTYSFELNVQGLLAELVEIQAPPLPRRLWISFTNYPWKRISAMKNLSAFWGNGTNGSCPSVVIGNFAHTIV